MRRTGARRLIDFSTSEVYGSQAHHVDEEATHGIGPVSQRRWVYAVSKLASEHLSLRYGEEYDIESTCVRPFNIYGPRQTGEGCISNFCTNLMAGKPLLVHGQGEEIRAWCHVSDMVAAIRLVLQTPAAVGKTFNIGNPSQAVSTLELARMLIALHGGGRIQQVPAPFSGIPLRIPNIERARSLLGFEPKVTLADGLTQTLRWYQEVRSCAS
jgi:UDP-glucuronate decarboxylase